MRNVERIDPLGVPALRVRDALARALDGGAAVALGSIHVPEVPENIALLIETGGTTGTSKIVALSAAAMRASSSLSNQALGATSSDRWSLSLPLNHIAGINQLLRSIDLQNDPVEEDGQFISVVPTQLYRALDKSAQRDVKTLDRLRHAKKVLIGGAAVPEQLINEGREQGIPLVTSYGMTEMCGGCIYDGLPLPGVAVRITDSGRIALKGPMQAEGYFENPEATAAAFVDQWFITSDEGEIDSDGRLRVIGRVDDVINSGGEKISPHDILNTLRESYPNEEIYVLGIPDAEWGQSVRVVMKSSPVTSRITLSEIRSVVADSIGKVAAPRSLLLLSEIPLKANGKLDSDALIRAEATQKL